jgi:hypothetical protein
MLFLVLAIFRAFATKSDTKSSNQRCCVSLPSRNNSVLIKIIFTEFDIAEVHQNLSTPVVPKVGGNAPWGAVGLPRWALIGTRGGRERRYYHRGS